MNPLRELFLLRDDVVYLNHGSFGACPRPVFEDYQAWQLELERQPVAFMSRRVTDLMREAREALAGFVGTGADNLVYVPNTTVGLNIIARSLGLRPGDEVLATDHEYGAMDRMWRFVCDRRGARYGRQPVPVPVDSPEQIVDAIWSGVNERTRVLFFSHITSPTAIVFPIQALIGRARERGLITIVDGAHAPGQIDLRLDELGADFYVGNCHKWLMTPKGSAFLYARPERQGMIAPLVVSWGDRGQDVRPGRFIEELEYQGTRDMAAYLAVPAAIRFFEEHGWRERRKDCHELLRQFRAEALRRTGLEPLTPDGPTWFRQMAAVPLPPCDAKAMQRTLYDDYHIEVPVIDWNGRQLLRVSVQGYNSVDDLEALGSAISKLLSVDSPHSAGP